MIPQYFSSFTLYSDSVESWNMNENPARVVAEKQFDKINDSESIKFSRFIKTLGGIDSMKNAMIPMKITWKKNFPFE